MSFRKHLQSIYAKNNVATDKKINTVVFCDPGLDDALMLVQLLSSKHHTIAGIVPGAGNVPLKTTLNNTLRICELAGRKDIKVFPGCKSPVNKSEIEMIDGTVVYGNDGLGGISIPESKHMRAESRDAIEFTAEEIISRKTLLISSGGLTDVYRVLSYLEINDCESLKNIIGISMMAGVMNAELEANAPIGANRFSEFNILFDPVASAGVFDLCSRNDIQIFLAPLDLTHSLLCSEDEIVELERIDNPVAKFAHDLLKAVPLHYQNKFGRGENGKFRQPLHDVHASACMLHPDIYQVTPVTVSVLERGTQAGRMSISPTENGNVQLLMIPKANQPSFFSTLIDDLKSYFPLQRVELFNQARAAFLQFDQVAKSKDVSVLCGKVKVYNNGNDFIIFGVKREDQDTLNFPELRMSIAKAIGASMTQGYIQFVGDSALYSKEGSECGKRAIGRALDTNKSIVLYGLTGSNAQGQADINQLISTWVDNETAAKERRSRVIANIVDEHTITAIQQWGCSMAENVRYFFLVYSDTLEPSAKFGDDIKSSDGITSEKAYALDGGIQSLRQIIYMLCRNVPVHGLANLRDLSDPRNPRYYDPVSLLPYLSAVSFIQHMKEKIQNYPNAIDADVLNEMAKDYLETHALYNKSKRDACTKEALWDAAWKDFVSLGWKKLSLFSYEEKPDFIHENTSVSALVNRARQQAAMTTMSATMLLDSSTINKLNK